MVENYQIEKILMLRLRQQKNKKPFLNDADKFQVFRVTNQIETVVSI